jgi:hypothetical protein
MRNSKSSELNIYRREHKVPIAIGIKQRAQRFVLSVLRGYAFVLSVVCQYVPTARHDKEIFPPNNYCPEQIS